jgi:thiamine kinase-like enzyme
VELEMAQAVVTAVGPVGVCVLAAVWLLTRRRENGAQTTRRNQVLETLAKIDADVGHLRDVTGEIKEDVRELRQSYTQHLQGHSF